MAGAALVASLLSVLMLVACDRVPKAPAAQRELTDADLPHMSLRLTDLPAGYTLAGEEYTPTDVLVANVTEQEDLRGLLESWGRVMGYRTAVDGSSSERLRTPVRVQNDIERFGDVAGARERLRGFDPLRDLGLNAAAIQEQKNRGSLGDEARAFRMLTHEGAGDRVVYAAVFRSGPVVSILFTMSDTFRDDKGDHAYRLSRLVDERIAATLK
jgi:hypothetical protein